jgi:hypothetical protein
MKLKEILINFIACAFCAIVIVMAVFGVQL